MLLESQIFKTEKLIGDWIKKEPDMGNSAKVILLILENQAVMMKEMIGNRKMMVEFKNHLLRFI